MKRVPADVTAEQGSAGDDGGFDYHEGGSSRDSPLKVVSTSGACPTGTQLILEFEPARNLVRGRIRAPASRAVAFPAAPLTSRVMPAIV